MRRGQFVKVLWQGFYLIILGGIAFSYQNCRKASSFSSQYLSTYTGNVLSDSTECESINGKYIIPINSNTEGTGYFSFQQGKGNCKISSRTDKVPITFTIPQINSKDLIGNLKIKIQISQASLSENCQLAQFESGEKADVGVLASTSDFYEIDTYSNTGEVVLVSFFSPLTSFQTGDTISKVLRTGKSEKFSTRDGLSPVPIIKNSEFCSFQNSLIKVEFVEATYKTTPSPTIINPLGPDSAPAFAPEKCAVSGDDIEIPIFGTDIFGGSLDKKPCKIIDNVSGFSGKTFVKFKTVGNYKVMFYLPQGENYCAPTDTCGFGVAYGNIDPYNPPVKSEDVTRVFGGITYKLYSSSGLVDDLTDNSSSVVWDGSLCSSENCAYKSLMLVIPIQ